MPESKSGALPLGYAPTRLNAPRIAAGHGKFNETMIPEGRGLHLAVATKLPPPALILQLSEIWTFESSALSYVGLGQSLSIIVDKPMRPIEPGRDDDA